MYDKYLCWREPHTISAPELPTNKQKKAVEELSRGIVNKLLHGPMAALRSDDSDPTAVALTLVNMHALERMFELRDIKED